MEKLDGLALTERTKRVFDTAVREATRRGHDFIGTEHLLMGILAEPDSVACRLLADVRLAGFIRDRLTGIMESSRYGAPAPPVADEELRDELFRRRDLDQAAQAKVRAAAGPQGQVTPDAQEAFEELQALNRDNTEWLKEVARTRGWPGRSLVGYWGGDAAWVLAQHADRDPAFQHECLVLLEKAVEQGEAPARHLAYLTDRVLRHDGRPQRYGTQIVHGMTGVETPQLEDSEHVDAMRAEVGLEPLCVYLERGKRMHNAPGLT